MLVVGTYSTHIFNIDMTKLNKVELTLWTIIYILLQGWETTVPRTYSRWQVTLQKIHGRMIGYDGWDSQCNDPYCIILVRLFS